MFSRTLLPLTVALGVSGCVSMTGVTDNSKFTCKAPDGVACTSVSGVYANAQQNNLPALQSHARPSADVTTVAAPATAGASAFPVMQPGMPIRSQPRMLRLWIAPWRDDDDSLHDQSYIYVMVDSGKWMVERSREATVQKSMTRLQLLGKPRATSTDKPSAQAGTSGVLASVRNNEEAQESAREAAVVPTDGEDSK